MAEHPTVFSSTNVFAPVFITQQLHLSQQLYVEEKSPLRAVMSPDQDDSSFPQKRRQDLEDPDTGKVAASRPSKIARLPFKRGTSFKSIKAAQLECVASIIDISKT